LCEQVENGTRHTARATYPMRTEQTKENDMSLPDFQSQQSTPTFFDGSTPYATPPVADQQAGEQPGEPSIGVASDAAEPIAPAEGQAEQGIDGAPAEATVDASAGDDLEDYSDIIDRHGKDVGKLAKSLHHAEMQVRKMQSLADRRQAQYDSLMDLIQRTADEDGPSAGADGDLSSAEKRQAERTAANFFSDPDAADKFIEQLSGTPDERLNALNALRAEMKKELVDEVRGEYRKESTQRMQEEAKQHNVNLYRERSRQILLEREMAKGKNADTEVVRRLQDPKTQLSRDELDEAYEQLQDEFEVVESTFRIPADGKWTMEHFRKAQMVRDPDGYRKRIEQEARRKVLADMKNAPNGVKRITPSGRNVPDVEGARELPDDAAAVHQMLAQNPALAKRIMFANKRG